MNNVAIDALVLKHQTISTHSADEKQLYWTSFKQKYYIHSKQRKKIELCFEKNNPVV